jgi:argininosuccinate synthase
VSASTTTYSINKGLWGTTIGGKETHDSNEALPEEAYVDTVGPDAWPASPEEITITYASGHPVALDGVEMDAVSLIDVLTRRAGAHGVGRGMHVGDTILGIKGRVGFEAPAATVLIAAHRELEKLVLTRWQQFQKSQLADFYGMLLHESQYFDPVMRDIEAFLDASQAVVTGTVRVRLHHGSAFVLGCKSPHSMIDTGVATYGETNALWSAQDAEGFSKILGMQSYLAHIARTQR